MRQRSDLQQDTPLTPHQRRKRRRKRTLVWTAVLFAVLLSGATASAFWLQGRELLAPPWLRDRIAAQIEIALPEANIRFGEVVAVIDDNWRPQFSIRDVGILNPEGAQVISLSNLQAGLDKSALLEGRVSLKRLQIDGVIVSMRRTRDGAIDLRVGLNTDAWMRQAPNLAELVTDLDELLLSPGLVDLQEMDVRAITLRYEDLRAERAWTVDGGHMGLTRDKEVLQISVDLALLDGDAQVATLAANYAGRIGQRASDFGMTIRNLKARDIASQGAAFSWLGALDAPISGALRGGLNEDGSFDPLNATLQIGAGVIQPTPEARPIPITGASSYFTYLPDTRTLRFDQFSVDSQWGRGQLAGQAVLGNASEGQIEDLVGQFRLSGLQINPAGFYPEPVQIDAAEMDFHLSLAPFALRVGRLDINDQGRVLTADGIVSVGQKGWDIAVDARVDALDPHRLMELWPEALKPKTRNWINENVLAGQIADANAAIRMEQGGKPRFSLGFDFDEADVRFLKTMPPLEDAKGHASLVNDRFVVVVDEGGAIAPQGGFVDANGTAFIVPDTTVKPDPPGVVRLAATSSVTAALSLLDQPPLQVMQKAELPVDVAAGALEVAGTISMPLQKDAPKELIEFDLMGEMLDVSSDKLVEDRMLAAPRLQVVADETEVQLAGNATLEGVPLQVVWRQPIGAPGQSLSSLVAGTVEISQETLNAIGIDLPPGTLSGSGTGQITLDLQKGAPPALAVTSNLEGLGITLPPIGWSKAAATQGELNLNATLGETPRVDAITLTAPGLSATGDITLTPDRELERLRLERVQVGNWLDAPVDLVGRGAGRPVGVVLRGGTLDLRRADLGGGGQSGASAPLTVALDRLQVSDTIAITDLRGTFSTAGGLEGDFQGAINGAAAVSGRVTPQNGRSAIELRAGDAGRVFAAAGLLQQARDGRLELTLLPVGTGGAFDGKLRVANARITDAPAMAALLNSISIVGLINELNGDGIYFSEINADFRLTPSRITLREASAVGSSMGLSMDGVFEPDTGRVNMEGVISPVYLLNSVGSIFTRRGEGLFGFNYSITGTAENPQVFVNPLTALAPGMLRNLFRGAQPEVPLEAGEPVPLPEPRRRPVVTHGEDR